MHGNNFTLWENNEYLIKTPYNPHIPYSEGVHLVVAPKADYASAWENPLVAAQTFWLASTACNLLQKANIAPWFNLQANGNWGLLPGATPFFHIHIYGRNKTEQWGKPVTLPVAPGTYQNTPMPDEDRAQLIRALAALTELVTSSMPVKRV